MSAMSMLPKFTLRTSPGRERAVGRDLLHRGILQAEIRTLIDGSR